MNSEEWDYWKVQGCRCDGGFEGEDCSQRKCPRGDDPLTVPGTFDGDAYTIAVTAQAGVTTNYFYLEIDDLYSTTHRSRTFSYSSAELSALPALAIKFTYLLLDIPALQSVAHVGITYSSNVVTFSFTLETPARINAIRFMPNACVDGCYPYVPASSTSQVAVITVATPANVLVETAECSNRGICDRTLGQCGCFTGHYGLACEHQTVLV